MHDFTEATVTTLKKKDSQPLPYCPTNTLKVHAKEKSNVKQQIQRSAIEHTVCVLMGSFVLQYQTTLA